METSGRKGCRAGEMSRSPGGEARKPGIERPEARLTESHSGQTSDGFLFPFGGSCIDCGDVRSLKCMVT